MAVLAVESATDRAGVAVADDTGVLVTVTVGRRRRHGESMAPAVEFACRSAGIGLGELDAVAVDVGPGLFTGLRVGLSTAKGLGFALGIPVVTATSLEILAHGALRSVAAGPADVIVPVVDARRGQLFWAMFAAAPVPTRVGDEQLSDPDELADELAGQAEVTGGGRFVCVGDGARRYAARLEASPAVVVAGPGVSYPDPAVLAELGLARLADGHGHSAEAVTAHYLRDADVRINWERRVAARPVGS